MRGRRDLEPSRPAAGPADQPMSGRLLGRGYQGAVYLVESPEGPVIVKCATGLGLMRRLRVAMLRREHAIYQLLSDIRGVPHCYGLRNGRDLVLEFIDGESLRSLQQPRSERDPFFSALLDLIQAVHAAGVAHGDLKRKDNIIVGRDGQPYLIDFGTAVSAPPGAGFVRRFVYRQARRMDLNAWFKLKYQRQELPVADSDLAIFRPTAAERIARYLRRGWRFVTLRRLRKRGSARRG